MSIPPISPFGSFPQGSNGDPLVQQFNQLWDNWYNDPTRASGTTLLDFLQKNQSYFAQIAANFPKNAPEPLLSFADSYATAENFLQGWLDHGCPTNGTSAPSEFIADIAKWINYAE